MLRVAFLGTPAAALPSLRAVQDLCEVAVVITRPDTGRGRSKRIQASPIAHAARLSSLPVAQPRSRSELTESLIEHRPLDAAIVVAYGQLIPLAALEIPRRGFVNVHFSLLPRWRGAAPVQRALLAGDERAGVSIMALDEGLDTGPIIAVTSTCFGAEEVAGEAVTRLSVMGARLLVKVLPGYADGAVPVSRQPEEGATNAPRITGSERRLNFERPAKELVRHVRALSPKPGAYGLVDGEILRVLRAREASGERLPGSLVVESGQLLCGTGAGVLELVEVQPAGRNPMSGASWARGWRQWPARLA